jgi:hypothetical protein
MIFSEKCCLKEKRGAFDETPPSGLLRAYVSTKVLFMQVPAGGRGVLSGVGEREMGSGSENGTSMLPCSVKENVLQWPGRNSLMERGVGSDRKIFGMVPLIVTENHPRYSHINLEVKYASY